MLRASLLYKRSCVALVAVVPATWFNIMASSWLTFGRDHCLDSTVESVSGDEEVR